MLYSNTMRKAYFLILFLALSIFCSIPAVFAAEGPCGTGEILKIGSFGPEVGCIQSKLGIEIDGFFGPLTRLAILAFQTRNGLAVDGVVGPKTLAKLSNTPPISGNFPEGCTSLVGYSPLTGIKCDTTTKASVSSPKILQNTNPNPNLEGVDEFIASIIKVAQENGKSAEEQKRIEASIRYV